MTTRFYTWSNIVRAIVCVVFAIIANAAVWLSVPFGDWFAVLHSAITLLWIVAILDSARSRAKRRAEKVLKTTD